MLASLAVGMALTYSRTIHVPVSSMLLEGIRVEAGIPWDELVASWTVAYASDGGIRVEARPVGLDRWYTLGVWTRGTELRYSVKDQSDDYAQVKTDTLVLKDPVGAVDVRVLGVAPKTLTLSFANRSLGVPNPALGLSTPPSVLDVPKRCQGDYPNGKVICSPTATSMILAYWARQLGKPVLDEGVETVCAGVYDPNWPGTGNWPFNTAYAGSLPGMRAFVSRLWHLGHLEALVRAGFPIACSVSYDLLKGKGKKGPNDGHLVVLVGFDSLGDPVFNDPGRSEVRQVYKRTDFDAAWAASGRTVYIIHPSRMALPQNSDSVW